MFRYLVVLSVSYLFLEKYFKELFQPLICQYYGSFIYFKNQIPETKEDLEANYKSLTKNQQKNCRSRVVKEIFDTVWELKDQEDQDGRLVRDSSLLLD
jgi:hypothetical protein